MNCTDSGLENLRAISRASLMMTARGVVGNPSSSATAARQRTDIFRSRGSRATGDFGCTAGSSVQKGMQTRKREPSLRSTMGAVNLVTVPLRFGTTQSRDPNEMCFGTIPIAPPNKIRSLRGSALMPASSYPDSTGYFKNELTLFIDSRFVHFVPLRRRLTFNETLLRQLPESCRRSSR